MAKHLHFLAEKSHIFMHKEKMYGLYCKGSRKRLSTENVYLEELGTTHVSATFLVQPGVYFLNEIPLQQQAKFHSFSL